MKTNINEKYLCVTDKIMNASYFLTFTIRTTVTKRRHDNEDKLNTQHMTVQKKGVTKKKVIKM
jgi:hypothetical protein